MDAPFGLHLVFKTRNLISYTICYVHTSMSLMWSKSLCIIIAVENSMHSYLIEQIKLPFFFQVYIWNTYFIGWLWQDTDTLPSYFQINGKRSSFNRSFSYSTCTGGSVFFTTVSVKNLLCHVRSTLKQRNSIMIVPAYSHISMKESIYQ